MRAAIGQIRSGVREHFSSPANVALWMWSSPSPPASSLGHHVGLSSSGSQPGRIACPADGDEHDVGRSQSTFLQLLRIHLSRQLPVERAPEVLSAWSSARSAAAAPSSLDRPLGHADRTGRVRAGAAGRRVGPRRVSRGGSSRPLRRSHVWESHFGTTDAPLLLFMTSSLVVSIGAAERPGLATGGARRTADRIRSTGRSTRALSERFRLRRRSPLRCTTGSCRPGRSAARLIAVFGAAAIAGSFMVSPYQYIDGIQTIETFLFELDNVETGTSGST